MKRMVSTTIGLAMLMALLPAAAAGQAQVTTADIQRLQDQLYDTSQDISRLRGTAEATRLQDELDVIREDVIYLRVKLRREGSVSRAEYAEVRDRLQDLRGRARGDTRQPAYDPGQQPSRPADPPPAQDTRPATTPDQRTTTTSARSVPAGTEIDVRLMSRLSSDTAKVEERFEATTIVDLHRGDRVLIPAGSLLRGVVSSVHPAGRVERTGSLTVSFDQITIDGRSYPMRGTVTQALESGGIREEAGRIGAGAGVGAIIGGIIGGVRGALLGVLIGGGGTIAATEGKDVVLPAGTVLRVRLDSPPEL